MAPDPWFQVPESERHYRGKLDNDVCIIDEKDIFVRGCLEIPIVGQDDKFNTFGPTVPRPGDLYSPPPSVTGNATPGRYSLIGRISYTADGLARRRSRTASSAASSVAQSIT